MCNHDFPAWMSRSDKESVFVSVEQRTMPVNPSVNHLTEKVVDWSLYSFLENGLCEVLITSFVRFSSERFINLIEVVF